MRMEVVGESAGTTHTLPPYNPLEHSAVVGQNRIEILKKLKIHQDDVTFGSLHQIKLLME